MANFYPNDHPPKILQRMTSFTPSMVSDCEVSEEQKEDEPGPPSCGEKRSLYERSSLARFTMDCGTCFTKYILCLFNFIILVAGAGVLFVGVWIYADKDSLFSLAKNIDESAIPELEKFSQPEVTTNIAYILMAVGGSMFVLSILGYCGALRESRCLLGFYGALLVLILILEITAGGLAFFYKDRAEDEVRAILKGSITNNYSVNPEDNAQSMFANLIMTKLHCCGVDNYTDFHESATFIATGLEVPPACCVFKDNNGTLIDPDCPKKPTKQNSYYMTGCYQTIMDQVKEHMNIVIYMIVGLVLVELLATFFSFCLCKSIEPYDK